MNSIIIGNGLNINFDAENQSNWAILNRLESNELIISDELKNDCLPSNNYGYWDKDLNNELVLNILNAAYNKFISGDLLNECMYKFIPELSKINKYKDKRLQESKRKELIKKNSILNKLEVMMRIYKNTNNFKDIGLEDYLFIFSVSDLEYNHTEYFKFIFNILIYNNGKVNNVTYDKPYINKLNEYDNIFTLNYDSNLEYNLKRTDILHLHGSFEVLDFKYNKKHPLGYRNKNIEDYDCMISANKHYYSNTLYAYEGNKKYLDASAIEIFNAFIDEGNYSEIVSLISILSDNTRQNTRTNIEVVEFIKNDCFDKNQLYKYYFNELKNLKGIVNLFGISPNNDNHIIKIINDNDNITRINFFYYDETDKNMASKIFNTIKLKLIKSEKFLNS